MSRSPLFELWKTLLALVACGAAFVVAVAANRTAGAWFPPAVAVVGLGCAAGRGAVGGAVAAVAAGALHAAAAGLPAGPCVIGAAAIAWGLSAVPLTPARRWAAAGVLGWACAGAASNFGGSAGWAAASLPASVLLGLTCGGLAAAFGGAGGSDRGWG